MPSAKKPTKTTKESVENEKVWAALSYLIFFLPLLVAKESKFAMYHASQGFNLFLFFVAVNVLGLMVPIIGWFLIYPIGCLLGVVLLILGIVNALNGEKKELPVIGKYKILKL